MFSLTIKVDNELFIDGPLHATSLLKKLFGKLSEAVEVYTDINETIYSIDTSDTLLMKRVLDKVVNVGASLDTDLKVTIANHSVREAF